MIMLARNSVRLAGYDLGEGPAVIFQHGLGGDEGQVSEVFPGEGRRRLTLECRAQGKSEAGDPALFSIAQFAEDVLAFADARGVERFVVGGISMGAAIALNIAATHPERVRALAVVRPAWVCDAAPCNMEVFAKLAPFLAADDRDGFARSEIAHMLRQNGPDNLASLLGFFDRPNRATFAELMTAIAVDGPQISEQDIAQIKVPTLVLGNALDWVHPIAYAHELTAMIAGAKFMELSPKSTNKAGHIKELRFALDAFLKQVGS
jgi:pimeloyl-ACP methyl ester carboxylesterase